MRRLILRRALITIPTIIGVTIVVFALRYLLPGGPVQSIVGGAGMSGGGSLTEAQVKSLRHGFGLDRPVPIQYLLWVKNIFHGDLGRSYFSGERVTAALRQRLFPSLELIIGALVISILVGGAIGIYTAVRRDRSLGRATLAATGLGISVPDFWLATIVSGFVGLKLGWIPAVGYSPLSEGLWANFHSIIGPVLILSVGLSAFFARHLNSAMTASLASPYVRTAWAMGLPPRQVYFRCALRSALGPIITFLPLAMAALVSGTVLVENVFAIPGLGSTIVTSVTSQDYPIIQATVLIIGLLVAFLNLAGDVGLAIADPRVRKS